MFFSTARLCKTQNALRRQERRASVSSAVQPPDPKIQIGRKTHPQQIRNLQERSKPIDLSEGLDHHHDQHPQSRQPQQGSAESLQIEEDDTPEKVKAQLRKKQPQTPGSLHRRRRFPYPRRANPHQRKQDTPHDGKHHPRRRKRRLADGGLIYLRTLSGQESRKSSHDLRQANKGRIDLPIRFFHMSSPEDRICCSRGKLYFCAKKESQTALFFTCFLCYLLRLPMWENTEKLIGQTAPATTTTAK